MGFFRDFNFLLVQYGIAVNYVGDASNATWVTSGYNNVQTIPIYTTRSGYFSGGSVYGQASDGDLWSSTTNSSTSAYYRGCYSSNVFPALGGNRQGGFPVRCINRDFNFLLVQYGIAVNYVETYSSATWTTSGYNNVQANPIYTTQSGYFSGGGSYSQASRGYLWSSTTNSGAVAYNLHYYSSNVYPAGGSNRQFGFPVRCIT